MKNTIKIISLVILFIIPLSAFLVSCDSSVNDITAKCMVDGELLTIDINFIKATSGGNITHFSTKHSLKEIKTEIDTMKIKDFQINSIMYGDDFLLIEQLKNNITCYFIVAKTGKENYYTFFSPISDFENDYKILVPYHLLSLSSKNLTDGEIYNIKLNQEYFTTYEKRDFINFYEKTGIFNIEITGELIIFTAKPIDFLIEDGITRKTFCIEFKETDNLNCIRFSEAQ